MGQGRLPRDENRVTAIGGESNATPGKVVVVGVDEATDRLLVQAIGEVEIDGGDTPTVTSVDDTATSTTLKAANASRKQLIIENDSTVDLYVLFGTGTASATNKTATIPPKGRVVTAYRGAVVGVWASNASGAAKVTEVV
jgi:hypothetical protein